MPPIPRYLKVHLLIGVALLCGAFFLHFINYYFGVVPFLMALEIAAIIGAVINVFIAMIRRFILSGVGFRNGIIAMFFLVIGFTLISGIRWALSKNFLQN